MHIYTQMYVQFRLNIIIIICILSNVVHIIYTISFATYMPNTCSKYTIIYICIYIHTHIHVMEYNQGELILGTQKNCLIFENKPFKFVTLAKRKK